MLPEPFFSWVQSLLQLLSSNDVLALFLVLLIEEAGIPLPAPGDLLIMYAGYRAATGQMGLLEAGIASTLAVQMGATVLYAASRKLGHALLFKYGRFMHLNRAKLDRVERWIQERGPVMVLAGRLTPGLRVATSVISGVFEIPFHQFLAYASLAAAAWSTFWLLLGYYFGSSLIPMAGYLDDHLGTTFTVILVLAAVGACGYLLVRRRRRLRERKETRAISGATIAPRNGKRD